MDSRSVLIFLPFFIQGDQGPRGMFGMMGRKGTRVGISLFICTINKILVIFSGFHAATILVATFS